MSELVSPLGGRDPFAAVSRAGVALRARVPRGLVQVSAWPETTTALKQQVALLLGAQVPEKPCYSQRTAGNLVMTIAPATLLVESDEPDVVDRLRTVIEPGIGSVTDLTDARTTLTITGAEAEWVLSAGIAIDLSLAEFPVHRVTQSSFDAIGVIMRRVGAEEFDLYVYSSFALALWDRLKEAGNCD